MIMILRKQRGKAIVPWLGKEVSGEDLTKEVIPEMNLKEWVDVC